MTSIAGAWRLRMKTPIGTIEADYRFVESDGALQGVAIDEGEEVALEDVGVTTQTDGQHVTWKQRVTRPMRLNLAYDVVLDGDLLTGTSRAGRLPASPVTGLRLPA